MRINVCKSTTGKHGYVYSVCMFGRADLTLTIRIYIPDPNNSELTAKILLNGAMRMSPKSDLIGGFWVSGARRKNVKTRTKSETRPYRCASVHFEKSILVFGSKGTGSTPPLWGCASSYKPREIWENRMKNP